jgi:hypothetical protein
MRVMSMRMSPGSCAAHKMGRKSAFFKAHARAQLAGSGDMRMRTTLIVYGNFKDLQSFERQC